MLKNETDLIIAHQYNFISQSLTRYVGIILYLLCLFGTLMNIITFLQRVYSCRACALYLLFASICDLTHLNAGALSNILQYGFFVSWKSPSNLYCSVKNYIVYLFTIISGTLTVLASIDRYILSSQNNYLWKWSSRRMAKKFIQVTILFWIVCTIPIGLCSKRNCHISNNEEIVCSNSYDNFFCISVRVVYSCFIDGFVPASLMMMFGFLTSRNARLVHQRNRSQRTSRVNQQLASMLVTQSMKSAFTSFPLAILNSYLLWTRSQRKTSLHHAKDNLCLQIAYLLFWSNYTSFFIYLYSSDVFRHQWIDALKQILKCRYGRRKKSSQNNHPRSLL